ncbi:MULTISPECIES: hypothetical protein [Acetobacter]|uniref:Uncharacterized protein n=1 Tax=Acetobacter pomorum DM001 TaxID=945681 RepID=F1YVI7_9PROT|nr:MULTISPECIES: hypothetical protein [Acetobacter]ATI11854.1 hypothetical protein CPF11_04900 [Acetobacter pomorum]AXC25772.1 hypothetical protein DS739_02530 [Acetobacter sp. JWB]EGE47292.1 Hypothetical protein APO_1977 [Acetobacter pomorum DM001]KAA8429870.1 hypothetical protein FKW54_00425 [Acetobacter pomorum]KAA8431843.1 hypothetical protein FKW50_11940 [Acetobacter pomorum]
MTGLPFPSLPISASAASLFYRARGLAALVLLPALAGCGYIDSRTAHKGQLAVIGMTNEDLQACAGIPDKTQKIDEHTTVYQYVRSVNMPSTNDSSLFPLQTFVNMTQTTFGGAGKTCVASLRMVDGRVYDLHYSGDNDRMIGTDGACSTVVKGCIRSPVASTNRFHDRLIGFGPVSAFHEPSIEAQRRALHSVYEQPEPQRILNPRPDSAGASSSAATPAAQAGAATQAVPVSQTLTGPQAVAAAWAAKAQAATPATGAAQNSNAQH